MPKIDYVKRPKASMRGKSVHRGEEGVSLNTLVAQMRADENARAARERVARLRAATN